MRQLALDFAPIILIGALVVVLGVVGYFTLWALEPYAGVFAEAYRLLVKLPPSYAKTMYILTVLLLLAASVITPLALLETRAQRAFAQKEEQLRRENPDAALIPYDGVEGRGIALDGPSGRMLLLHPEAGVGAPRVILPEVRPQGDSYPPDAQA